jgi:hypothetical protein
MSIEVMDGVRFFSEREKPFLGWGGVQESLCINFYLNHLRQFY